MTEEKLNRGKEIEARLKILNDQLKAIEKAEGIWSDRVQLKNKVDGYDLFLKKEFIDFDVLITLATAKVTSEKKDLEKEFASL